MAGAPGGEVIVYEAPGGEVRVDVRLERETVWLSQAQMAELFGRERSVVTKHIRNVFGEGELDEKSNVQNLHIAGSDKPVRFYNLEVIISVGYRVKSVAGTRFRQWATRTLREHLVRGYTLDRQRFAQNAAELEAALALVRKAAAGEALTTDQGRGLVDVIARYTQTFLLLQRYDEGLLVDPKGTPGGVLLAVDQARAAVARLKADLIARGDATDLFGRERESGLAALLGNLDQSVFGEPAYPTIESKAEYASLVLDRNDSRHRGENQPAVGVRIEDVDREEILRTRQSAIEQRRLSAGTSMDVVDISRALLKSRRSKRLQGNPVPGSTHELCARSHGATGRLFGNCGADGVFVFDHLTNQLP